MHPPDTDEVSAILAQLLGNALQESAQQLQVLPAATDKENELEAMRIMRMVNSFLMFLWKT